MLAPTRGNGFPWGNPSEATLPSAAASPDGLAPLPAPCCSPLGFRGVAEPEGAAHGSCFFFFIALVQTKCQAEANFGGVHPGRFRPECDENGDYLPKQCHAGTGYCWCCYKNGTKIEGTATRGELDCSGRWRGEQRAQLTVRERQPGRREGEHGAGTRPLDSWCPGS